MRDVDTKGLNGASVCILKQTCDCLSHPVILSLTLLCNSFPLFLRLCSRPHQSYLSHFCSFAFCALVSFPFPLFFLFYQCQLSLFSWPVGFLNTPLIPLLLVSVQLRSFLFCLLVPGICIASPPASICCLPSIICFLHPSSFWLPLICLFLSSHRFFSLTLSFLFRCLLFVPLLNIPSHHYSLIFPSHCFSRLFFILFAPIKCFYVISSLSLPLAPCPPGIPSFLLFLFTLSLFFFLSLCSHEVLSFYPFSHTVFHLVYLFLFTCQQTNYRQLFYSELMRGSCMG